LVAHHTADTDATGIGQGFEPCCDINTVAVNITPVFDDVAKIDPHAELNAAVERHVGVSLRHLPLHFDSATHRVDDTGKLDEQAVACRLHDAAVMFLDFGVGQLAPKRL
jgi:hypothetical protein